MSKSFLTYFLKTMKIENMVRIERKPGERFVQKVKWRSVVQKLILINFKAFKSRSTPYLIQKIILFFNKISQNVK